MRQLKIAICLLMVLFSRQAVAQTWEDLTGRSWPIKDAQSWVVINYWALWCAPCRSEVPELNELARLEPELWVLGVNFDQPKNLEQALNAKTELGIEFPVLRESPHQLFGQTLPVGLPATDLIAPGGKHRLRLLGPQTANELLERIAQFTKEEDRNE